jgi:hypothetical protein
VDNEPTLTELAQRLARLQGAVAATGQEAARALRRAQDLEEQARTLAEDLHRAAGRNVRSPA